MDIKQQLYDLIVRTSTDLPADVEEALVRARNISAPASAELAVLDTILKNVAVAREKHQCLCQDTGTLLFTIQAPVGYDVLSLQSAACEAVRQVTADGILRRNCVNSLTGRNVGDNIGHGNPVFHLEIQDRKDVCVSLMLKGGGSENMGCQYSLPDTALHGGRDLAGVRRCILDAVNRIQGMGCAPGILGVAIGGDRATGYAESKELLKRHIGERSQEAELAELERRVLEEVNSLGIGAMGLGGRTTLLDLFIGWRCRIPASYFVSISYMCWCCRRQQMLLSLDEC